MLGNASVNPYEALAYTNTGASGLLNQSQCEWGAPIFISSPQFYGASSWVREGVENLEEATAESTECYVGVEPVRTALVTTRIP
jgi:hypothetical protein